MLNRELIKSSCDDWLLCTGKANTLTMRRVALSNWRPEWHYRGAESGMALAMEIGLPRGVG